MVLPAPIHASAADLPGPVRVALEQPPDGAEGVVEADGIPFATRTWGDPDAPPILLVHGVTSSSRTWWRVGPALAVGMARFIVAVDQAGHGRTGHWAGKVAFRDNAATIVAFARAAGIAGPGLRVVGHSWGGMTAAALPSVGLVPEVTVLLDPPAIPLATISSMLDDPIERHYDDLAEAVAAIGALYPTLAYGDVFGKAEALTQFDEAAVRAVLTENGDWDGRLAALAAPEAAGARVRLIRGEVASGGLVPDAAAEAFAERIGPENVLTIAGGSHSPMRTRIEATTLALLRALEPG